MSSPSLRRRLAIALACTLGVVALALGGAMAVLELSPRDYRLAWRLRRTIRIEWSNPAKASRVVEIADAAEIGEIVSTMTSSLDRRPRRRIETASAQLRFFLDDGTVIVAAVARPGDHDRPTTTFIRSAPDEPFRPYATDDALVEIWKRVDRRPVQLGAIHFEGSETQVQVDFRQDPEVAWLRFCEMNLSGPGASTLRAANVRYKRKIPTLEGQVLYRRPTGAVGARLDVVTFDLDELDAIEMTLGGHTETLRVPDLRFHEPILPPCPSCGSEDVVPFVYECPGDNPLPFHGRCKPCPTPRKKGGPSYSCEKCQQAF